MQYLMMPLDEHYDFGFGATAEAFFRAAHLLGEKSESNFFFEHLPQNFLLRHAIELFLKSGIVIIHRTLKLAYGESHFDSKPLVPVDGKWKPFHQVHSIGDLYAHWKDLIAQNADKLKALCKYKPDWTIPPELDGWIAIIEKTDPGSTYYRYPANRDPNEDKKKSLFKETDQSGIFPPDLPDGKKVKALVIENEKREFVRAFVFDGSSEKPAAEALSKAADTLNNYHAMMRIELTSGY
jgi:hypothetical protein